MTHAVNKGPHDLSQKRAPAGTLAHSVTCRRSRTRLAEFAMKPKTCCALCKSVAAAYATLVARIIKESAKKKRCISLFFFLFLFFPPRKHLFVEKRKRKKSKKKEKERKYLEGRFFFLKNKISSKVNK